MIKNRIFKLQNALNDGEAFWISSGSNRFYLTGFNSSAGSVLITRQKAIFFIDFRYFEKAKQKYEEQLKSKSILALYLTSCIFPSLSL